MILIPQFLLFFSKYSKFSNNTTILGVFIKIFLYCSYFEHYICSKVEHMKEQDYFEVLRKIEKEPKASQRQLADELGFSLGKLNYCLKALKEKGLVKLQNFKRKK